METGKLDANRLIQKAIDEDTLPNSVLNRQQADRFIDLVVDYSVLLKQIRVVRINHQKGDINKLDIGQIATQGAKTTSTFMTTDPTESVVEYDTEKYRSGFDLKTDFIEDNLEGSGVRDTLLNMFTKRIAVDTEMASIEGDDDLPTGDAQSRENNLLGVNDGFFKILTDRVPAGQQLDAGGKASSKNLFYSMKRKIPPKYRVAKPDYRWLVPSSVNDKWMLDVSDRATAQGDEAITGTVPSPFGIKMVEVPLFPEDLDLGTASGDGTKMLLTPMMNLIYFIQRDITIEWDRVPRKDQWEVTIHFRVDFQVENEELVVMAHNVSESGADYA